VGRCLSRAADCVYCCVQGCMVGQVLHEMDHDDLDRLITEPQVEKMM
jgi:hypothetical protein